MSLISLICCLLALSSSAFGRTTYGSYSSVPLTQTPKVVGMRDFTSQIPVQTGYGQSTIDLLGSGKVVSQESLQQPTISSGYSVSTLPRKPVTFDQTFVPQTYGSQMIVPSRPLVSPTQQLLEQQQQLQQKIQETLVLTEADTLCRGQRAETVIPLDNGRRFVVCLDESKGYEQQCPRGLYYHVESRRCERKLGPLENPCASQPCLNGGQCVQTEVSSFQCQCLAGFDGKTCELDARVCQTQYPCGQSPDSRCQSFRVGAALQYICILQNGLGYGLNGQQVQPNPCQGVDGPRPLAISDKGFIMCDGEAMFIESCPGGTVWDDVNRACVWPDMQGVVAVPYAEPTTTSVQRPMITQPTYTGSTQVQRPVLEQPKFVSTYGQSTVQMPERVLEQQKLISTFGQSAVQMPERVFDQSKGVPTFGQGTVQIEERPMMSEQRPMMSEQQRSMMSEQQRPMMSEQSRVGSQFGSSIPVHQPIQRAQMWQQPMQRQTDLRPVQSTHY